MDAGAADASAVDVGAADAGVADAGAADAGAADAGAADAGTIEGEETADASVWTVEAERVGETADAEDATADPGVPLAIGQGADGVSGPGIVARRQTALCSAQSRFWQSLEQ